MQAFLYTSPSGDERYPEFIDGHLFFFTGREGFRTPAFEVVEDLVALEDNGRQQT